CVRPTLGFGCQLNVYVLQLGELEKAFQPVMASQAGLFHTTEFHRMEEFAEGVDPNRPGSHPLRYSERFIEVVRPDGGDQPVERVVGDPDRLVQVREGGNREDRAKDLFLGESRVRRNPVEDGWIDEVAIGEVALG